MTLANEQRSDSTNHSRNLKLKIEPRSGYTNYSSNLGLNVEPRSGSIIIIYISV